MQFARDKQGRSVREMALIKWFVRRSYVTPDGEKLPGHAIDAWAEVLVERMATGCRTSCPARRVGSPGSSCPE